MATGLFDGLLPAPDSARQQQLLNNYQMMQNSFGTITATNASSATNSSLYGLGVMFSDAYSINQGVYVQQQQYLPEKPKPRLCEGCKAGESEAHAANCDVAKDRCECHHGRASKFHGAVEMLRREIEAWHGNILERCPA